MITTSYIMNFRKYILELFPICSAKPVPLAVLSNCCLLLSTVFCILHRQKGLHLSIDTGTCAATLERRAHSIASICIDSRIDSISLQVM